MKKVVLTLLILVIGVLPAHAQTDFPLVKVLSDAGVLHDINLTETRDDISVTVNWGYADESMFAVHTTITGLPEPEQDTENPFPYHPIFKLTDTDGNLFTGYANGTGISYSGDGPITLGTTYLYFPEVLLPDNETYIPDYFSFKYENTLPETLDFHLEVNLDTTEDMIGPFNFDFSVPLLPAQVIEPGLNAEASDVEVTLTNLRITPSSITATLCYDREDMGLDAVLSVNSVPAEPKSLTLTEANCTTALFEQTGNLKDSLTLTVERLRAVEPTADPDFRASIQAELAKQGIVIEYTSEDYLYEVKIISLPAGMDEQAVPSIMHDISLSLRETIEGPWTFTVSVPEF